MKKVLYRPLLIVIQLLVVMTSALASDGFFTVGQQNGRWWFFDPEGEIFFSTGVCVTNPEGYYAPDLGYSPYYVNIMNLYGSEEAWAEVTLDRLEQWNFNTLGAWSDIGLLGGQMPYTIVLGLAGADWQYGSMPDYFSDIFYDHVNSVVASEVAPRADDPNLIGYFFDNELRWGPDWRDITDVFAEYFAFPADAPGKIELVNFLEDRYHGDVNAFNAVWHMSITSFDDLLAMTQISPVSLDPTQREDRTEFTRAVAEQFFATCHDAIKAADPNHLLLGTRFVSWVAPKVVVEAIAPYTDVVTANHYVPWPFFQGLIGIIRDFFGWTDINDTLSDFYALTGKPLLITEFSVRAMDSGLPNTYPYNWFFETLQTQQERADWFENYARQWINSPFIIGYHWFSYMDEPPEGRFDGENSNFGLVDNNDIPWGPVVSIMTVVNSEAYNWPPIDDDSGDDDSADDDSAIDDDSGDDDSSDDDLVDDDAADDDSSDDDSVDDDSGDDDIDDDAAADDDSSIDDDIAEDDDASPDDDALDDDSAENPPPSDDDDDSGKSGCGC